MNIKNILFIILGVVVLAGCTSPVVNENENQNQSIDEVSVSDQMDKGKVSTDEGRVEMADEDKEQQKEVEYSFEGVLEAVDGGNGTGVAKAVFADGKYMMMASIENIPDPEEGFFYEGWVVRPSPFNFISTGELEKVDGKWINNYMSETDYSDHIRYVLTIEPDDNDPAPADHVVEGDMIQK